MRTLDEVRELPALRTKVQRGLEETKSATEADSRRADRAGCALDPGPAIRGGLQE